MQVVLEFDDVPASQNRQLRMHWSARRQHNERLSYYVLAASTEWAREHGVSSRIWNGTAPPARVKIEMWRSRRQDPDNAVASCKGLIDRLVRIGALRDDTTEWLTDLEVIEHVGAKQTRIEINYEDHPVQEG